MSIKKVDFFYILMYNVEMESFIIKSQLQMIEFARNYARKLKGGQTLSLVGEMGAGKTVFAKGICEGLGVLQLVTSPTFSIMNEYDGKDLKVYHFDFYRIIDENEAEELGLTEHFGDFDAVCVVEWGANVSSYMPNNTIKVVIDKVGESGREVTIYD